METQRVNNSEDYFEEEQAWQIYSDHNYCEVTR